MSTDEGTGRTRRSDRQGSAMGGVAQVARRRGGVGSGAGRGRQRDSAGVGPVRMEQRE